MGVLRLRRNAQQLKFLTSHYSRLRVMRVMDISVIPYLEDTLAHSLRSLALVFMFALPLAANAQSFPADGAYAGSATIKCSGSCAGVNRATPINFRLRKVNNVLSFRAYASSFPLSRVQGAFVGRAPGFTSGIATGASCNSASSVAIAPARSGRLQYAARVIVKCSDGSAVDLLLSGQVRRQGN